MSERGCPEKRTPLQLQMFYTVLKLYLFYQESRGIKLFRLNDHSTTKINGGNTIVNTKNSADDF